MTDPEVPGVVFVQLDGVPFPVLRHVARGEAGAVDGEQVLGLLRRLLAGCLGLPPG